MSKKSTSRTGSDGEADYSSANGRSSSAEKSPHLSQKEEAAARASGDYSSTHKILTRNLDNCHRNHVGQTLTSENTYKSTSESQSNLDYELYGNNDAFSRNLEYLRKKLNLLVTRDVDCPTEETNRRFNTTCRSNSRSSNTESSCDSKFGCQDKSKGYLSTRETYIDLNSPLENCKASENPKTYSSNSMGYSDLDKSIIRTIYEASEIYETDNTNSTDSYRIPLKKVCLREKTPTIGESSPINLKINIPSSSEGSNAMLCPSETSNEVNISPTNFRCPALSSKSVFTSSAGGFLPIHKNLPPLSSKTQGSSTGSSINYSVPSKKICLRPTPTSLNIPNDASRLVNPIKTVSMNESRVPTLPPLLFPRTTHKQFDTKKNPYIAGSDVKHTVARSLTFKAKLPSKNKNCSSRTIDMSSAEVTGSNTERTKSDVSEILELGLNIPSSVTSDCTSSSKTTPIEPNVVIIDTSNINTVKFKPRRKVFPAPESSTGTGSGDHRRSGNSSSSNEKRNANLYRKYYEDTSEVSSNRHSTPPGAISTCASKTSSFPNESQISAYSVTTRPVQKKSEKKSPPVMNLSSKVLDDPKPEVFNPLLSSSLDISKISLHVYSFPAISKITSFPGSFMQKSHVDDCDDGDFNDDVLRCNKLLSDGSNSYRKKAKTLLASPTVSPARRKSSAHNQEKVLDCDIAVTGTATGSWKKPFKTLFRKKQSTDMSFYSVPSHVTLDEEFSKRSSRADHRCNDSSKNIKEKCGNSCCLSIFFPKRKTHFFT